MLRGRMHITFIMVLFTVVSARKLFEDEDLPRISKYEGSVDDSATEMKAQIPVNFRFLTREGFGDKQPIDFLHLGMISPKDVKNAPDLLKKPNNLTVRWFPPQRRIAFPSPRDEMEYYKNFYASANKTKKITRPFDFPSLLEKNLQDLFANRRSEMFDTQNKRQFPKANKVTPRKLNITDYFAENRFYRRPDRYHPKINWTTCDEFAKNAVFHPEDIVNTKWLPFFIWSRREFRRAVVHTFSYPTKKDVQYFKTAFGSLYKNIDWNQPKLLLNERRRMLLIAGDRKGFFYGLPDHDLPKTPLHKNVTLPTIPIRLKIHDPYLAMMYCEENYATIMAEIGTEPTTEREAIIEASTLNFKGHGVFVRRDMEFERFSADLQQKRKAEQEAKKFIHIPQFTGDVDMQVKHA